MSRGIAKPGWRPRASGGSRLDSLGAESLSGASEGDSPRCQRRGNCRVQHAQSQG